MSKKTGSGCFSFLAIILISLVCSSFIKVFLSVSSFVAFILTLFFISFIYGRITHKESQKSTWRYVKYSVFFLVFLLGIRFLLQNISNTIQEFQQPKISENIYTEKIYEKGDSIVVLSQNRRWNDNYGNSFQGHFSVREKDYELANEEYFKSHSKYNSSTWGDLYQSLANNDTPRLDLILNQLQEIQSSNSLNQFEFADMVVTFIQDIPYALVFQRACEAPENYEESIRAILEKCPSCCIGNIPHGVQNPVGFMGNLKGDCDTRTVIIYAILSYFGYDVAILNSEYYRHSILGLNIPAKGTYKLHKGKRYYVWETTNKHYTIGTLPDTFDNINHWQIMLTNTLHHGN